MTDLSDVRSAIGAVVDAAKDAAAAVLGGLPGTGLLQHARMLRLHTPLGADVLVAERAVIQEGIGPGLGDTAFGIELYALSARADLRPVDLLGQPVRLDLLTSLSAHALRPFHGHVLAFELMGSDGGLARYRLRIGTWLDFLRERVDAWCFQDRSVVDITESVFADYVAQGGMQPAWRWDLKDRDVYPRLSTFSQHRESDFDFLARLWAANGLFHWFEHQEGDGAASLGQHVLVIADHNGAFARNAQARIRYTQSGASMKEDSITRWHGRRSVGASMLHTASHDYREVRNHAATAEADAGHAQDLALVHADQPGAYAFESRAEAERLALIKMQSLQAERKRFHGRGTVRTLAPATTFVLSEHAEHDQDIQQAGEDGARFVVLSVTHRARNNIAADAQAGWQHLLEGKAPGTDPSAEPLYGADFIAQRAAVPYRAPMRETSGRLLQAGPTAHGLQTAVVVGLEAPVHTDRDGRVKVQFHWQRGERASHRLAHPSGEGNAPASDASGTWVRVAQDWAGANWGGVFIPRIGQEVVVAFLEGDIDRPVIVGAAYNGQGSEDEQGNRIGSGAAGATGNAPAWFPGSAWQGDHAGHAHNATLSGFKSQSLDSSSAGTGDFNQLVLDDTPGQGRVLAHTTQYQTWMQIGHLLQQHDNQRLAHRGHGMELHTQAQGALRAGSGLHISTHGSGRGTHTAQGQAMQTREAQSQLQAHGELVKVLSGNAQTHLAQLPQEPAPEQLPVQRAMQATLASLRGTRSSTGQSDDDSEMDRAGVPPIDGGHGSIPVTERPDLVLSAAADIASMTPADTVLSAGGNLGLSTGQDANLLSQRHMAWAVKDGISLFTRGEAKDGQRAVQDVGMKLHAASGNVNVQAQGDAFKLTAQKGIDLQSTAAHIVVSAPEKILLNGGGSYIKIEGGNIELGTSGAAQFKAGMKVLTGGSSASGSGPELKGAAAIAECPSAAGTTAGRGGSAL